MGSAHKRTAGSFGLFCCFPACLGAHPTGKGTLMAAFTRDEQDAMRAALRAAAGCDLPSGPNPRVGCVLLTPDGRIMAVGVHRGAGTAHAEVDALGQVGEAARGATAVVTLEPCNHTGRTGPCAQALREAGIARVIYAQRDPNPQAQGGAVTLREAGIDVVGGLLSEAAAALNPYWSFAVQAGRPFVTVKYASSLDGRIAAPDGTSQWITGPLARADVHELRASCDAILCGTGTALADNPRLTARTGHNQAHQPRRFVMGRRELPADAALWPAQQLPTHDPVEVLATLAQQQVRRVLIEGGAQIVAAFLRADLVDEVVAYLAPALLGAGTASSQDFGVSTLTQARRLRLVDVNQFGDDVRLRTLRPELMSFPGLAGRTEGEQ